MARLRGPAIIHAVSGSDCPSRAQRIQFRVWQGGNKGVSVSWVLKDSYLHISLGMPSEWPVRQYMLRCLLAILESCVKDNSIFEADCTILTAYVADLKQRANCLPELQA